MKKALLLLLWCCYMLPALSQNKPTTCEQMLQDAQQAEKANQYEAALRKYNAAKKCDPSLEAQVDKQILAMFEKINGLRLQAEQATSDARNQKEKAQQATKQALALKAKADTTAEVSRIAATALEIQEQNPLLAIRLASYAYTLPSQPNPSAARIVSKIFEKEGSRTSAVQTFIGHTSMVSAVAFSPDGQSILTGSTDSTAILWDIQGNPLQVFNTGGTTLSVAFSPDGKSILTGIIYTKIESYYSFNYFKESLRRGGGVAILWDLQGNRLKEFNAEGIGLSVVFAPDGKSILTGSADSTAILWNLQGNRLQIFKGHNSAINSVAFAPDGKSILTGSEDGVAILWDLQGNRLQVFKGHERNPLSKIAINSVAFAPDGKSILTGSSDWTAILWDLQGNRLRLFKCDRDVTSVAFAPDGKRVLTGCTANGTNNDGNRYGAAILWDLNGNRLQRFDGHIEDVRSVAFSPDGKSILTGSMDNTAILWNSYDNRWQYFETSYVGCVAFAPDGKSILTGCNNSGTAILWDLQGRSLQEFKVDPSYSGFVAFAPNGKSILTSSGDKTAILWDLQGNRLTEFKPDSNSDVNSVAFTPDGESILTKNGNQTILWDLQGNRLQEFSGGKGTDLNYIKFSPNGKYILTDEGDYRSDFATLVDLHGNRLQTFRNGRFLRFYSFSPDGKSIFTSGEDGGSVLHKDLITSMSYFLDNDFTYGESVTYKIPFKDYHKIRNSGIVWQYAQVFRDKVKDLEAKIHTPYVVNNYPQPYEYQQPPKAAANGIETKLAIAQLDTAKTVLEYLVKEKSKAFRGDLAEVYQALGRWYAEIKNTAAVMQHYEKAEQIYQSLIQEGNAIAYNKKQLQALYADWFKNLEELGMQEKVQSFYEKLDVEGLQRVANNFYYKGDWKKAEILDEKSFKIKDSPAARLRLYQVGLRQKKDRFQELLMPSDTVQLSALLDLPEIQFGRLLPDSLLLQMEQRLYQLTPTLINKARVVNRYNTLGWNHLLGKDWTGSERYLQFGLQLDTTNVYLNRNVPHLRLFQGKFEEAKTKYLELKDQPYEPDRYRGFPTFKEAFLADFDTFKRTGLTHPDIEKIKALLAAEDK